MIWYLHVLYVYNIIHKTISYKMLSYISCVIYLIEHSSLACIGSFGIECVKPCPSGYHGIQCSEKCLCDECHRTTGACPNLTITTGHVQSYHIYYLVYLLFKKTKQVF